MNYELQPEPQYPRDTKPTLPEAATLLIILFTISAVLHVIARIERFISRLQSD